VKLFLDKLRNTIKNSGSATTEALIRQLNPKIRGWSNYYRHVVFKRTFSKVDQNIFCMLWQWTKRRHPNKSAQWRKQKYYRHLALRDWIFFAKTHDKDGFTSHLDLAEAAKAKIRRHLKIKGSANPYELAYDDYFDNRSLINKSRHIAIVRDERCQSTF
ncbi:MAG: RNA-directed DNA polymerase, partial [Paraglaciecola sp.]